MGIPTCFRNQKKICPIMEEISLPTQPATFSPSGEDSCRRNGPEAQLQYFRLKQTLRKEIPAVTETVKMKTNMEFPNKIKVSIDQDPPQFLSQDLDLGLNQGLDQDHLDQGPLGLALIQDLYLL